MHELNHLGIPMISRSWIVMFSSFGHNPSADSLLTGYFRLHPLLLRARLAMEAGG